MAPPPPVIPGWTIHQDPEGTLSHLVAVRHADLSPYQRAYGAMEEIHARDEGELWILADAQTRLAERLATAEKTLRPIREHGTIRLAGAEMLGEPTTSPAPMTGERP